MQVNCSDAIIYVFYKDVEDKVRETWNKMRELAGDIDSLDRYFPEPIVLEEYVFAGVGGGALPCQREVVLGLVIGEAPVEWGPDEWRLYGEAAEALIESDLSIGDLDLAVCVRDDEVPTRVKEVFYGELTERKKKLIDRAVELFWF